jgi:hypothetical protein
MKNMRKNILQKGILIGCCLLSLKGYSQATKIGLNGGIMFNKVNVPNSAYAFVQSPTWQKGSTFNLVVQRETKHEFLFFTGSLGYAQKKQVWERVNYDANEGVKTTLKRNYLQANVMANARVTIIKNLSLFGGAGFFGSYWMNGKWQSTSRWLNSTSNWSDIEYDVVSNPNITEIEIWNILAPKASFKGDYEFDKSYDIDGRKDNRLEFGWAIRSGIQYDYKKLSFIAEYGLMCALTDMQKFKNSKPIKHMPAKNLSQTIQIGILYNL